MNVINEDSHITLVIMRNAKRQQTKPDKAEKTLRKKEGNNK